MSTVIERAKHHYRTKDAFTYLALHYYASTTVGRREHWISIVPPALMIDRRDPIYLRIHNFKEVNAKGEIEYRVNYLPDPVEALAEGFLIEQCARSSAFHGSSRSYAYRFAPVDSERGPFQSYMKGLQARQADIAAACRQWPDGVVRYIDIRRFYPSVAIETARAAWRKACDRDADFAAGNRELGESLLSQYGLATGESAGLLVGPQFSHLIANLLLRAIDEWGAQLRHIAYFRYVDDFTLVGDREQIELATIEIESRLSEIGLLLHPPDSPKSISTSTREWLTSELDFGRHHLMSDWMRLVLGLKTYLLIHPSGFDDLFQALQTEGLGIPLLDYRAAARASGFIGRLQSAGSAWLAPRLRGLRTPAQLTSFARALGSKYLSELLTTSNAFSQQSSFERKRRQSKLRFLAARLVYLGDTDTLAVAAAALAEIPEVALHTGILRSLASPDADSVLRLGASGAQAVAQAFRARSITEIRQSEQGSEIADEARATLALYGVAEGGRTGLVQSSDLLEYARSANPERLIRDSSEYIRHVSALHRGANAPLHYRALSVADSLNDDLSFGAINLAVGSS